MKSFKQITRDEFERGDYRPVAGFERKADEILRACQIKFDEEHIEDGLGRAKTAYFLTSNDTPFFITEFLETVVPLTQIYVLYNPDTWISSLNEVLESFGINSSDVDFVNEYRF